MAATSNVVLSANSSLSSNWGCVASAWSGSCGSQTVDSGKCTAAENGGVLKTNSYAWNASDWLQGGRPCALSDNSARTWKHVALADWTGGAGTCCFETWRDPLPRAELSHAGVSIAPPSLVKKYKKKKGKKAGVSKCPKLPSVSSPFLDGPLDFPSDSKSCSSPAVVHSLVADVSFAVSSGKSKKYKEKKANPNDVSFAQGVVPLPAGNATGKFMGETAKSSVGNLLYDLDPSVDVSAKPYLKPYSPNPPATADPPKSCSARTPAPPYDRAKRQFDFLVIGSGIAGLRYALAVAHKGSVAIITKSEPQEGSTNYAQGGVSAVLDPLDSVENHIRDTIVAGAHLNDEEVVEVVCREGPDRVRELMSLGASFDRGEDGQLHLAREGGHSHHRIVHAADVTGREIERALLTAVINCEGVEMFEHFFVVDLITEENEDGVSVCKGVKALNSKSGMSVDFFASVTLLASGGAGHVYPNTTNPMVATGDGVAIAHRAGAIISNMEFVQFHPTSLFDAALPCPPSPPRANAFLITEAVRGEGGRLFNQSGERFMQRYDSVRMELAPRDVVARSIDEELKKRGEKFVWLDISHKKREEILSHFPNIAAECARCGLDITRDPIPVVPAAHYMCGGVQSGLFAETSIVGLFSAGEVACTGLHGANRLASNSLLEALVFAERAVKPSIEYLERVRENEREGEKVSLERGVARPQVVLPESAAEKARERGGKKGGAVAEKKGKGRKKGGEVERRRALAFDLESIREATIGYRRSMQDVMWEYVGIVRSTQRLHVASQELKSLKKAWYGSLAELTCVAIQQSNAAKSTSAKKGGKKNRAKDGSNKSGGFAVNTKVSDLKGILPSEFFADVANLPTIVEVHELRNLLSVAELIVESAMHRHESRGLHYTVDFPESCETQRLPTTIINSFGDFRTGIRLGAKHVRASNQQQQKEKAVKRFPLGEVFPVQV